MSSLNDCIKIQHHIKGTSIIFSDYSEKIDDKSQKVLIADLFRTLFLLLLILNMMVTIFLTFVSLLPMLVNFS